MRMYSGWNFSLYHRQSYYGIFNKDNLHKVHGGPEYDIFLLCTRICTNQHNKRLFSNSFIIFLVPAWLENMVQKCAEGQYTIPAPSPPLPGIQLTGAFNVYCFVYLFLISPIDRQTVGKRKKLYLVIMVRPALNMASMKLSFL